MKGSKQEFQKSVASLARYRDLPPAPAKPAWDRVQDRLQDEPEGASAAAQRAIGAVRPVSPLLKTQHVWIMAGAAAAIAIVALIALFPRTPAVLEDVANSRNVH